MGGPGPALATAAAQAAARRGRPASRLQKKACTSPRQTDTSRHTTTHHAARFFFPSQVWPQNKVTAGSESTHLSSGPSPLADLAARWQPFTQNERSGSRRSARYPGKDRRKERRKKEAGVRAEERPPQAGTGRSRQGRADKREDRDSYIQLVVKPRTAPQPRRRSGSPGPSPHPSSPDTDEYKFLVATLLAFGVCLAAAICIPSHPT